MFYLTIVNKTYVTVTLGWHDNTGCDEVDNCFATEAAMILFVRLTWIKINLFTFNRNIY